MPDRAHQPLALQVVDRALPAVVVGPRIAPDMELLEIDRRQAEEPETLLGVLADVIGRIRIVDRVLRLARPLHVLRRDLGRDVSGRVDDAPAAPVRAGSRSCPARRPTPCRRNCSRAPARARARVATAGRPIRSSRPCPTCRSRFPRPASRCVQRCECAYTILPHDHPRNHRRRHAGGGGVHGGRRRDSRRSWRDDLHDRRHRDGRADDRRHPRRPDPQVPGGGEPLPHLLQVRGRHRACRVQRAVPRQDHPLPAADRAR